MYLFVFIVHVVIALTVAILVATGVLEPVWAISATLFGASAGVAFCTWDRSRN